MPAGDRNAPALQPPLENRELSELRRSRTLRRALFWLPQQAMTRTGLSPPILGYLVLRTSHTAQQAQPSAPQKLLKSDTGSLPAQARAWSWPCTLQRLAQPHDCI